jgi:hypothetical protein
MSKIISRRVVLATALAGAVILKSPAWAKDKTSEELTLKSAYTGKVLVAGARQVHLSVTLDEKGNGSGTLTLDSNLHVGLRSTTAAVRQIPVRVQLVRDEEQSAKGRRLYELTESGPEWKVKYGDGRWFLVQPIREGTPCWLVFVDQDGKFRDLVALE